MSNTPIPTPTPGTRRPRRRRGWSPAFLAVSAIAATLFILFILFVAYELIYRNRVILGVSIVGQPMSGLTRGSQTVSPEKVRRDRTRSSARYGGEAVIVHADAQSWRDAGNLDCAPISVLVAEGAIVLGHRGSWWDGLSNQLHCLWFGCDLGAEVQFDEADRAGVPRLARTASGTAGTRRVASALRGYHVVTTPAQNGGAT